MEQYEELSAVEQEHLSRHIYCQYCKQMSTMVLLGRNAQGRICFRCPVTRCGEVIEIDWARGDTSAWS
jgi:hypothetical protein